MKWFEPRYLIHGHIHLYELNEVRRTTYLKTEVVNCYDHLVLDFPDE
jgi:UDP-2,3-diacylglucosamine pyrophosphatase LpxH